MPKSSALPRVTTYLLGFFVILVASTMLSCIFGNVTGTEFNPYTFQSRSFYYLEVPVVHFQIRATQRTVETNALQDWITNAENVLAPSPTSRWDLVSGRRLGAKEQIDRSNTLYQYLNASNHEGELVWLLWSKSHTESARKLWPAIAWLGQSNLYYLAPEVMNLAKREGGSAQFPDLLDEELAELASHAADKIDDVDPDRAAAIRADVAAKEWHSLERPPGSAPAKPATKAKEGGDNLPAEADDPGALVAPASES